MDKKRLEQIEKRVLKGDICEDEMVELIAEVRALQSENTRLCPVADLPAVASLRADLQLAQEQVAMLERMLEAANEDAERLASEIRLLPWWKSDSAAAAVNLHAIRYTPSEDDVTTMISLSPGWYPGLYNPEHGGTYRVRSLKQGADTMDEKTCCFDAATGWETEDEVIEWKEINND